MFLPLLLLAAATPGTSGPLLSEPSLSPDHSEIAFVSGGDIWTVPAQGGEARLLVSHPATESRPLYSPDGSRLAFLSSRTGIADLYVVELRTGALKRLTFDDARISLDSWSPDGKFLLYSSNRSDIAGMNDIFKIPAAGGTPAAVSADRYSDESQAAPHPSGNQIAFVSGGMAVSQWWRKGHSHIDETKLALLTPRNGGPPQFQPLVQNGAKNLWPMWSADGRQIYFMSDKSGTENIWKIAVRTNQAQQVTRFTDGRVLWPSISRDGAALVFERDFRIWRLDPATGTSAAVPITLRGAPAGPATTHLFLNSQFRDLQLSPDGKKISFTARGQLFAASARDGGNAVRLTQTTANETEAAWAPDNHQVVYVSDRDGVEQLYLYDLSRETETRLSTGNMKDEYPLWSPDGKNIAYIRDGRELHVLTLETKEDRTLATRKFRTLSSNTAHPISWSPDGEWLACFRDDTRGFRNVSLIPVKGGPERAVSFLGNLFSDQVLWAPDRSYLLFSTAQRTEKQSLARVDLIPRTPKFREDQFRDLFRDFPREELPRTLTPVNPTPAPAPTPTPPTAAVSGATTAQSPSALLDNGPKTAKPVRVVFEGIRRRLSLLPLDLDAGSPAISPDGKLLLFIASSGGGQQNLYTYSLDELAREPAVPRQLTSTAGPKSDPQFSPDNREVFFLEGGRIQAVVIDTRVVRPIPITAELDVDFEHEKREVFHQAWTTVNETYYDANFHGANWSDLRGQYSRYVEAARTPDETRRVISLMIGELNSSHSGISGGQGAAPPSTGRLGLTVDPTDFTVTAVTPLGPADVAGIKAGVKLLAIDGTPLTANTNLDQLLQYKIGKRTVVSTSAENKVPLLPISGADEKQLIYKQWVDGSRAYVSKLSGGRLGYVHIPDMSAGSLDQLHIDLDTENQSREGVVIDIRNNNGGFINAYALDIFARQPYLTMTPRDHPPSPARSMLGQRSLELPTVLVTNQNSLSDAEDFTEGYRALKLGKVVGVPTAGWIIYTGAAQLIDGSVLRRPFIKITANDGTDMELHPRPVDVEVDRPVGESYTGRDAQLDAAVKTLLGGLPKR